MMFKDTKIWNEQGGQYIRDHCGQYPVIFITFNECSDITWEEMRKRFVVLITKAYARHRYIYEKEGFLSPHERKQFDLILDQISMPITKWL